MSQWTTAPTKGIEVVRNQVQVEADQLAGVVSEALRSGSRLALCSASDDTDRIRLVYLLLGSNPDTRTEVVLSTSAENPAVDSLATFSFSASRFEREFHDLFGVLINNHPLPRRLVRHGHWSAGWYPMRKGASSRALLASSDDGFPFVPVDGPGIYEIPVGPIHAGLIEPGHFRFYAVGETVVKLKIRLWYLHKGLEKLFEGIGPSEGLGLAEKISGDTSVGHCLAYTLAVEDALGITVSVEVSVARSLLLEMERLYNHIADMGAMANDVGFSIANAHALQLREKLLRINQRLTGHRLLRGAISIGGVKLRELINPTEIAEIAKSVAELASITLDNAMVRERFGHTAVLLRHDAEMLAVLGPVARATGIDVDARISHPFSQVNTRSVMEAGGDVMARFLVRQREFETSAVMAVEMSEMLKTARITNPPTVAKPTNSDMTSGIGIVEAWRGAITTRVELDSSQRIKRVKVVDPSWFNWPALPLAMRDTIVPDFPLANKSFNLAYSGNDL